ncbi:MAG: protein kinase [Myxococcales bacterium]|nr:protein kinase [Myxococcales bacterium]
MDRRLSYTEERLLMARGEPVSLGRYGLRRKLGAGASSTVWAAYDPEEDHEVAVTLMRTLHGRDGHRDELAEQAAAWQRVDHPNVAKISDLGTFVDPRDGTGRCAGVFVVRELVSGVALQRWLDTLPPGPNTTAAILEVFCAAGQGLAAAHGAGVVHRDVCPASIIVGYDGKSAQLIDFAGHEALPMTPSDGVEVPRYPAPELRQGREPSVLSDQYSLCASLLAALRGHGARVNRRLRQVLERGMAEAPEQRWPSMAALLQAIGRTRSGWYRAVSSVLGDRAA